MLNCLERAFNILDKKYQRTFSSQQMPFHYPSSIKHFSSWSKHDKNRVFSHIRVEDIYETYLSIKKFGIWQRNLEHMSKTHFLIESVKICGVKTFLG